MLLAFTDLETTGLDERKGSILELAMVVTDERLKVLGYFSKNVFPLFRNQVWNPATGEWDYVMEDANVLKMHTDNGLIAELKYQYAIGLPQRRYQVEEQARVWLEAMHSQFKPGELIPKFHIVGNSIWFDKAWVREHMPGLHMHFHRHVIDITSINKFAELFAPNVFKGRPRSDKDRAHRALYDAEQSLESLKYYRDALKLEPAAMIGAPELDDLLRRA